MKWLSSMTCSTARASLFGHFKGGLEYRCRLIHTTDHHPVELSMLPDAQAQWPQAREQRGHIACAYRAFITWVALDHGTALQVRHHSTMPVHPRPRQHSRQCSVH